MNWAIVDFCAALRKMSCPKIYGLVSAKSGTSKAVPKDDCNVIKLAVNCYQ